MKIDKLLSKKIFLIAVSALVFASCKKTTDTITTSPNDSANQGIVASDELKVNDEMDRTIDDAIAALSISPVTSGGTGHNPISLAPGIYVDSTDMASGTLYINYSTTTRTGELIVQLPVLSHKIVTWNTPGVTATITFPVTSPYNGYEVFYNAAYTIALWFKGTINVTNVSGGLLPNLVKGDSLTEKVNAQISFTHNDNVALITLFTWNLYKNRIIKLATNNDVTVTTKADTNVNGINNVTDWGMTCFSQNFWTSMTTPIFQDITASTGYSPLSGAKTINDISEPIKIIYGVDQSGNPVTLGTPYGYIFSWTNTLGPQSAVVSY